MQKLPDDFSFFDLNSCLAFGLFLGVIIPEGEANACGTSCLFSVDGWCTVV